MNTDPRKGLVQLEENLYGYVYADGTGRLYRKVKNSNLPGGFELIPVKGTYIYEDPRTSDIPSSWKLE